MKFTMSRNDSLLKERPSDIRARAAARRIGSTEKKSLAVPGLGTLREHGLR
jgi:hypothetical protein